MDDARSRQVVIAGAGVAGLTAALAFSERGYLV
ncbi:MAG: FAD-binding protein, partial [Mesorhizobium sp.]